MTSPSHRSNSPAPDSRVPVLLMVALAVWVTGFLFAFFRQTLPNNPQFSRRDIWLDLADQLLGGSRSLTAGTPALWTIEGLNDRLPLIACGSLLFGGAWLMGSALILFLKRLPGWWPHSFFSRSEEGVLQAGIGLALLSTWTLLIGLCGSLSVISLSAPTVVSAAILLFFRFTKQPVKASGGLDERETDLTPIAAPRWSLLQKLILYGLLLPFSVYLLAGSLTPSSDFDVREYHLQGPKEWFQAGHIYFLRHNVYTSFPFLTEMISLAGMIVAGDPWRGSLVGQFVLATYALLTSLTVFCIARRLAGNTAGLVGSLLHLTTPWTLRISIIALVEGALTFYVAASALLLICVLYGKIRLASQRGVWCVAGILSGSAMACKYTGLISVILPATVLLMFSQFRALQSPDSPPGTTVRKLILTNILIFGSGVLLIMGPWFYRNFMDTGNPVYPLADALFQSPEWNQEIAVRWKPAHSASEHSLTRIPQHLLDVALRNDWSSGILFALLVPATFLLRRGSATTVLGLLIIWQFAAWWAFTHRIDRFWVPAIPLVAAFSSLAWTLDQGKAWKAFLAASITVATLFNLQFCRLPLVGFHSRLMPLAEAEQQVIRGDFQMLNERLPENAKVLMVGEAEVFDARFDLVYNTVFDDSIFEQLAGVRSGSPSEPDFPQLRAVSEIKQSLREEQITHVLVNWNEILRYRLPGSYGYTPWLQPRRFEELQKLGILRNETRLSWRKWDDMSDQEQQVVESWEGFELLRPSPGTFSTIMLYEVTQD